MADRKQQDQRTFEEADIVAKAEWRRLSLASCK